MLLVLATLFGSPAMADEAPGWTMVMPFGVPQIAQHRTRPGLVFGGVQVLGVGAAVASSLAMRNAASEGNIDAELNYRLVSAGAVFVAAGAWFGSTVDASHYRDEQAEAMSTSAQLWSAQRAAGVAR